MPTLAPNGERRLHRARRRRRLRWGLLLGLGALAFLVHPACTSMGASATGTRSERMQASPQWGGASFTNRLPTPLGLEEHVSAWQMAKRWIVHDEPREPTEPLPLAQPKLSEPPPPAPRITWLGHSTMLIELDGRRVLADPVWGPRASPVTWAGPERFHPPPLSLDALPPLDAVVLSHDHYDHLDKPTIEALAGRVPVFVAPLGLGAHLELWGVPRERIVELDWWESHEVGTLKFVATPCRHFSGRGLTDRNGTLWASWAILGPRHRVFFSGDTGMHEDFDEIGERLGPFDVTMLEVGAYDAWWRNVHLGPEQALEAHRRLRGRLMLPIHWGTFNLALHAWTEPPERLVAAAARLGVTLAIPRPGESIDAANPPPVTRWWPDLPWQTAEDAPVTATGLSRLPALPPPLAPEARGR